MMPKRRQPRNQICESVSVLIFHSSCIPGLIPAGSPVEVCGSQVRMCRPLIKHIDLGKLASELHPLEMQDRIQDDHEDKLRLRNLALVLRFRVTTIAENAAELMILSRSD